MTFQNYDFWATLLWDNYLPLIESGAPFYLAADSILIHEWIRKHDPGIDIEEALDSFHQSCFSLVDRTSTKGLVKDNAFARVPGKVYSRAICLAVQQVLVVEKMLAHEQYSERSYFPRYRHLLGISAGNIHLNPIDGFQRIWSTLRHEIVSVPGSSSSSTTFCSGTGMDVNRNLPLSQALFTRHDLEILHQQSVAALRRANADEIAMIQILCHVRGCLNRRAQHLISKATTDARLCNRLCQQVQSFVSEERTFSQHCKMRQQKERTELVAFLDTESWLDAGYCVYSRFSDGSQSAEGPTSEELVTAFSNCSEVSIALISREDRFEEISTTNLFEQGDKVIAVIMAKHKNQFINRFCESYTGSTPIVCRSNLPEEYLLVFCGELDHAKFFDPLGRRTKVQETLAFKLTGGLLADARSHTFLAGYPPCGMTYKDNVLVAQTEILVNGLRCEVGNFLQSLTMQRHLASYVLEYREQKLEFKIAPTADAEKSSFLFGFPLNDKFLLGPTATVLNEGQPALRGAVFAKGIAESEAPITEITSADLLMLFERGKRVRVSNLLLGPLLDRIRHARSNPQLIDIATREISTSKSMPVKALQVDCIKRLWLSYLPGGR